MSSALLPLLPGFRVAADKIRQSIDDGTSVVIVRGEWMDTPVTKRIIETLQSESDWLVVEEPEEPVRFDELVGWLRANLGVESARPGVSVQSVLEEGAMDYQVVCVDVMTPESIPAWIKLLKEYSRFAQGIAPPQRGCFLISFPFGMHDDEGAGVSVPDLRYLSWDSMLNGTDTTILAHHLTSEENIGGPLWRSLKAAVIAVVAGVDVALCAHLSTLSVSQFDELVQYLTEYKEDLISSDRHLEGHPRKKGRSGYIDNDGLRTTHILSIQTEDELSVELNRRIWRAQAQVLYPFLEAKRWQAIQEFANELSVPHTRPSGQVVTSVEDFEFADIVYQLGRDYRSHTQGAMEKLRYFRMLRNSLAHFEPLGFEDLVVNRGWLR